MIERRPVLDFISHLVLITGILVVAFPVYLTFVASTLTAEQVLEVLGASIAARRLGRPEDMADLVCFLASERACYITGTSIFLDGGMSRSTL